MIKIKWILLLFFSVVLIYTRFTNLSWGLPYPMHPDERNMANAVQNLNCSISKLKTQSSNLKECFNPHFFAYGQFPIYTGYGIVLLMKFFDGDLGTPVSFEEAVISLRVISAIASIINVIILLKLVQLIITNYQLPITKKKSVNNNQLTIALLIFTFSPFFIQFSHFGTTESLLMLLLSVIVYLSIKFSQNELVSSKFLLLTSISSGLAIASKVSSVLFIIVPIAVILDSGPALLAGRQARMTKKFISVIYLLSLSLIFSIIFSPHNFISFSEFLGAMHYESDIAFGLYRAFYTRQFEFAEPVIFQIVKIFPYVLGWQVFIFSILGFFFLPLKKEFNILRLAILVGFIPSAFFYAKWTRFISPAFPLLLVTAVLFTLQLYSWIKSKIKYQRSKINIKYQIFLIFILRFTFCVLCFTMILPGIAFLSIYLKPDVRFTASEWVYKNIQDGSYILSETANVVDIPLSPPKISNNETMKQFNNLTYISFNFYDLDENPALPAELQKHLALADYILIPSRRIFANQYCPVQVSFRGSPDRVIGINSTTEKSSEAFLRPDKILTRFLPFDFARGRNDGGVVKCEYLREKYPLLNDYYDKLFSGKLGFMKVAEFSSFPKIEILGKTIIEFPDEEAEETWTVFDHPVLRIYKSI